MAAIEATQSHPQKTFSAKKFLTGSRLILYTRRFARDHDRAMWAGKFNVDEQETQRASDQMAAVRRHVRWRLCVRYELVSDQ